MTTIDYPILAPITTTGAAFDIAKTIHKTDQDILFITQDDKHVHEITHLLRFLIPNTSIVSIPAWDCLPYDRVSPSLHVTSQRLRSLSKLISHNAQKIILTTANAVTQKTLPKDVLANISHTCRVNDKQSIETLIHVLVQAGYIRVPVANEAGEFAVRGSLIDIIPTGDTMGVRLDFFGSTIESIKYFDPLTQISKDNTSELTLYPASETLLLDEHIQMFKDQYRQQFGTVSNDDPLYHAVLDKHHYAGMEHWLPLFYHKTDTLFDYIKNPYIIVDHLVEHSWEERQAIIQDYYTMRSEHKEDMQDNSYNPITPEQLYLSKQDICTHIAEHKGHQYSLFTSDNSTHSGLSSAPLLHIEASSTRTNIFELLKQHIQNHKTPTIIGCYSEGSMERLTTICKEHEIASTTIETISQAKKPGLYTSIIPINHGVITADITLFSEQDLLGDKIHYSTKKKRRSKNFLTEAQSLNEGELVVHKEHGLGRFIALETISVSNEEHDCLQIEYARGDRLYIPVENIDAVTRYGSDDAQAQLDSLGSLGWQQRKAKLKERLKIAAQELMDLAAKRSTLQAPNITTTAGLYDEFCARFPYHETEDQLRCIDEVKEDLLSGKPMDRLICGDVGFGKTEVALRAAFLAASQSPPLQVALITPTTLLARQHLQTFNERFKDFPISIAGLSRLVSNKEAISVRQRLKEGNIDIVIGTHALLSKKIEFKRLGLVIIDEEQQFGVIQKEKLKKLRTQTHVLTLSATPIPRTLQMSLAGIKELSLIATPPVDRLAIRSYTMPYDKMVLRNAILREYYRGGGIFVVVPRISDLDDMERKLASIVPEINMVKAHGQMAAEQLDKTMEAFYDGKYQLLLATNIIGSGLDIPHANTIIVYKADRFGLAQLYQMRGRVGRGKVRAYAYFVLPEKTKPTPNAIKRLEIIQSLDSLGAGFTLASHDMDMRGFGNLVGDEQSGHIKEVGIELYQHMLQEAIESLKNNEDEPRYSFSPQINIGIPVLIPKDYIDDLELRLGLYKRIAALESNDDIDAIRIELRDRFGVIPVPCENLLNVMRIKQLCLTLNIEKVDLGPKGMLITLNNNTYPKPAELMNVLQQKPHIYKLNQNQRIVIKQAKISDDTCTHVLDTLTMLGKETKIFET